MKSSSREMDPVKAQQLAAELEVEMMADMYNRYDRAPVSISFSFSVSTISVAACWKGDFLLPLNLPSG